MISLLLMASKQLSELEKDQIVAYTDCRLLLYNIAKKLNHYHSFNDVFIYNYKKTGNYQEKDCGHKRKSTASEDTVQHHNNLKSYWKFFLLTI